MTKLHISKIKKNAFITAIIKSAILAAFCSVSLLPVPVSSIASAEIPAPKSFPKNLKCKDPQTQLEMNLCSSLNAKSADKHLNEVYRQVRQKYKGIESENLLIDAQLNWIKYRDSACLFSSNRYKGGSIMPLIYNNCIEKITRQRSDDLEIFLKEGQL